MKLIRDYKKRKLMEGIGKAEDDINETYFFLTLEGNHEFGDIDAPTSVDNMTRKVYIVRLKDVHRFIVDDKNEILKRIQKDSGATIAIISTPEVEVFYQAYLELWGTDDQVNAAEVHIREAIKQAYDEPYVPTSLMQAPLCHNELYVPLTQAKSLMDVNYENVVKMEAECGAWIEVVPLEEDPPPGHLWMKRFMLFGTRAQIYKAMVMVYKVLLQPYLPDHQEFAKLEDKEDDINGINFLTLEGGLKFVDVEGPTSSDNLIRKVFLVRRKDVQRFIFEENERLKRIQKESGATIALISTPKVEVFSQLYLELWGALDQVKAAESHIMEAIKHAYDQQIVPTLLMQAPLWHNEAYVPVEQADSSMGKYLENVAKMEAESGAWIEVDSLDFPPRGHLSMKRLKIFGTRAQIYKVMAMVYNAVLDPYLHEHQKSANLESSSGSPSSNPTMI